MQRRTPYTLAVAPPMPPWIHSSPSRSSLAGLEIGLPPSPAPSGRAMSIERPSSRLDKALPPLPKRQENANRRPSKQFLSVPETRAPLIPEKNPRRFSWVSSDLSPTSASPLRRTSSSIHSSISNPIVSPSAFPAAASLPPSDWRKTSSTPQPLKLNHPTPVSPYTNKVAQLTGCDLFSDVSPSHYQRPRFESDASISSSLYSDDELSAAAPKSRGWQHSDDSLGSIVDSYSDWGSWAPSKDDFPSPLSSPQYSPSPKIKMDAVAPEDVSSTTTITSQSNTRTPVPPVLPPPRNRSQQGGPSSEGVTWRASYLNPPTLEHLIAQERTHLESGFVGEQPLSPLAQLSSLQLQRDSRFGNSGEERICRSAVRPQASMPTISSTPYLRPEYAQSRSRFSDGSSDEEDDTRSIRSMASGRLRNGARGVRDSFMRGLSGLNRPVSGARSRLSQLSDTALSSQRTSETSATTVSPEETHRGHKHTLSSSTSYSIAASLEPPRLVPSKGSQKQKTRDSGFSRSWNAATQIFKKPLRSSYNTHRAEITADIRGSKGHTRMTSAPAKFFGEGIRQARPDRPQVTALVGEMPAPRGTVDLSEARKNNVVMLPEEIVAASRLASEYTNKEEKDEKEDMSPVKQATAVLNGRRFSITGKAGKVLGSKDTTSLPPPLPIPHCENLGLPLIHVHKKEKEEAARRAEESEKGRRGSLGMGFSVMAVMGREIDSFKAKAGIRSREEKRREQLKGLIRVVEVDEKEKGRPKKAAMPTKSERNEGEVKTEGKGKKKEVTLGLSDEELSDASQLWL